MKAWRALNLLSEPASVRGSRRKRVRGLLDQVAALTLFPSTTTFWRGQPNAEDKMTPRLARTGCDGITERVGRLLDEAVGSSHLWREGVLLRGLTPLERLALLQHTGTDTPLLDLTADPLVALYFASLDDITDSGESADGLLIGWNNDENWKDLNSTIDPHADDSYADIVATLRSEGKVGFFTPPVVSDRIVVQKSRLLVAPLEPTSPTNWASDISDLLLPYPPADWSERDLKRLFEPIGRGRRSMPPVVGFRVPRDLKRYIRDTLDKNYGISHPSLFPDAAGFAETHHY